MTAASDWGYNKTGKGRPPSTRTVARAGAGIDRARQDLGGVRAAAAAAMADAAGFFARAAAPRGVVVGGWFGVIAPSPPRDDVRVGRLGTQ